ncbi:MAG: RecX family transcriptional regulator [Alphaproteobacteria bacterium]
MTLADEDPLGEAALRAAALAYLARYAATAEQVRRVLARRIRRHGGERDEPEAVVRGRIDAVVARLVAAGLISDRDFAETRAAGLMRRGTSTRRIAALLRDRGVPDALAAAVIVDLDQIHGPERERFAALRHAQRRRLGPWAAPGRRADRRRRDLAAMVRAGFAPALATWVIDLEPEAAAQALDQAASSPE